MNRNKPLRSKKPLKRHAWMRQRRARPRRSGRVRDADYLQAVRALPCLLADSGKIRVLDVSGTRRAGRSARLLEVYLHAVMACDGPVEADHAGERPVGRKADDTTAIPLCRAHHRQRTDYTGVFAGLDAAGMRLVLVTAIAETRARVEQRRAA